MFEHLDDPSPPAADLGSVLDRAGRYRHHRRARAVLAASLAVMVAAVAVVAGLVVGHGASPAHLSAREIAYQYKERPDPLPAGTPVPTTALADVVFVDADDGFALALHKEHVLLAGTTDGGAAWQVVNPSLPVDYSDNVHLGELEFTDLQHGYLWDGAGGTTPTAPLWVTSDGGRDWQRAPIGPVVFDVSAIGADVWAVVGSCPLAARTAGGSSPSTSSTSGGTGPATAPSGSTCSLALETSSDDGAQWLQAPGTVPAAPAETSSPAVTVELARITPTRAYVLSAFAGSGGTPTLAFTADGGATWVTRPVPCAAPYLGAELAASSTDDLWLFCGGQATAGSQDKALYRSVDGGTQWVLASAANGIGASVTTTPGTGTLPLAGYLAPYSIGHLNLAVASPSTAWIFPPRGEVQVTVDGGKSWQPVTGLSDEDIRSGTAGNLTFISATEGWVCELGVGLWRTTDGVDWSVLG